MHRDAKAAATVVTAIVERPYGYGRIIRTAGRIARIVEERDASPTERQVREINSGIYAFDLAPLFDALRAIAAANAQGEYYLTDLIAIYRRRRRPIGSLGVEDPAEVRGVNSRTELAELSAVMRQKKNEELMAAGVTLIDPATTYIDPDVSVGPDTVIHPGVVIQGQTRIGAACEIHAHVHIADTEIADRVTIHSFCFIVGARVAKEAAIGPFAHVWPRDRNRATGQNRQFRRAEENLVWCRVEGKPSGRPSATSRSDPTCNVGAGTNHAATSTASGSIRRNRRGSFTGATANWWPRCASGKALTSRRGGAITEHVAGAVAWGSPAAARRTSRWVGDGRTRRQRTRNVRNGTGTPDPEARNEIYVRNHRIYRIEACRSSAHRGAPAYGVSRLQFSRRGSRQP